MLTPQQVAAAQAIQHNAAHDANLQVRVVAGPGTGKSSAIEERVFWLLSNGVQPQSIRCVSFTRASSDDLRQRVRSYCIARTQMGAMQVRISTLHSLALRTLRSAGLLAMYPVEPLVLDDWELENVFDAEFGATHGIGVTRRKEIRTEHEAFWSTGQWGPPNYIPPNPPITAAERAQFNAFHTPRTQTYACVLPGEIVRTCVGRMQAGLLNPVDLLGVQHLVVDEFQDLNPMDLIFVDQMIAMGATTFVAGDDDQSIYSFRFASPAGIQDFVAKYPNSGQHMLSDCFRSTPNVLGAAAAVIAANAQPNRIPKNQVSLYGAAAPPEQGVVHRWSFAAATDEAAAIAQSCRDLVAGGLNPRDILLLLGNKRALLPSIEQALAAANVPFEPPRAETFIDGEEGRLILSILRIVCAPDDYVAHRVLLGLPRGIGVGTCNSISQSVIANNLNYQGIFYGPLPNGVFTGRTLTALNAARAICQTLGGWAATDAIAARIADMSAFVVNAFGPGTDADWLTFAAALPAQMNLSELRDFMWADKDDQQEQILHAVMQRVGMPIPHGGVLPPRVRIMTMHGAKGLSAKVVFVPGLEDEIIPGPWRNPYPGLVLEAARLLYVSLTRARAACVVSYARRRQVHGQYVNQTPSRFAGQLAGPFVNRVGGLNAAEIGQILAAIANL